TGIMRPGMSDIPGRKIPRQPTMRGVSYGCASLAAMNLSLLAPTPDTRERFRALHAGGRLIRVRRGIYARPGGRAGGGVDVVAVVAAASRLDAVASHATAAALWGIPVLGWTDDRFHLTRPRRHQGTLRDYPDVVLHHAAVPPDQVTVQQGVPVTTPARTVLDLARSQSFLAGAVAADAALRTRCTRAELDAALATCRGWPGSRQARRVAAFADPRAESPLESISRVAFHRYGLPPAILQAVIGGYDRADFLWERYRVIGEADGLAKYTDADVLRREKLREEELARMGFTVVRWTWRDAYHRPDALAHHCLTTLTRCGYSLGGV
ncbi:MAG: DUF559 domain-containing protein, partial [Natronosporangium sp.]